MKQVNLKESRDIDNSILPVDRGMARHPDFTKCATERDRQLDWAHRLFAEGEETLHSTTRTSAAPFECRRGGRRTSVLRPLLESEIAALEQSCRCRSSDWSKLRLLLVLVDDKNDELLDQSKQLRKLVTDTCFEGRCILILSSSENQETKKQQQESPSSSSRLPIGIHGCSVIANSILHLDTARVHRCTLVENAVIGEHAVVANCGSICCATHPPQTFELTVGPESGGGRPLRLAPEATMVDVGRQLRGRAVDEDNSAATARQQHWRRNWTFVGAHCVVQDTSTVDTVHLHAHATIQACSSVQQAILFSHTAIRHASTVSQTVLQWNANIDSSRVASSLIMEHARVGPHSLVTCSVLGPDAHVSAGEVHASVLGPNTNAHHQSLLISVLAPLGRGNVGYGANVGSNHTGRIPDQECCAGEGTFWGLSCVVKFPVDLSSAPYSIVAAGTALAPQRCTMPFSLIIPNETGGTSIVPGWVLRNSPYTVVRSEKKFASRRQAVRHGGYTGWKIMRPETIRLCLAARAALQSASGAANYLSDKALPGIGASELSEKGRLAGIQAYTECIQLFALQGLYSLLLPNVPNGTVLDGLRRAFLNSNSTPSKASNDETTSSTVRWPAFPWDEDQSPEAFWNEQRAILLTEFPRGGAVVGQNITDWARDLLKRFLQLERTFAERVYVCKHRDDVRGRATIPNYSAAHILADQDSVIADVRAELKAKEENVQLLLQALAHRRSKL